ncbi:MAG: hypothetical protein J5525_13525 [Lachnospiraceae bacterium]|nr:hypothetical protein [Lachnospiraceae bacterium]
MGNVEYTDIDRALYEFEHRMIPILLNRFKSSFIKDIRDNKKSLNKIFHMFMEENNMDDDFSKTTITVETIMYEDVQCEIIKFPSPRVEPLCYEAYILYDTMSKFKEKYAYFCLERGKTDNSHPYLCEWRKRKGHVNYGQVVHDRNEILKKMIDVFKKQ